MVLQLFVLSHLSSAALQGCSYQRHMLETEKRLRPNWRDLLTLFNVGENNSVVVREA